MSKQPSHVALSPASCWGNCQRFCAQTEMFTLTFAYCFARRYCFLFVLQVSLPLPLGSTSGQVGGSGATFWKVLPGLVLGDTLRQEVLVSILLWRVGGQGQLCWARVSAAEAGSVPWCPAGRGHLRGNLRRGPGFGLKASEVLVVLRFSLHSLQ